MRPVSCRGSSSARAGKLTIFTQQLLEHALGGCEKLFARLDLKLVEAFGHAELGEVPLDVLHERLQSWSEHPGLLADWAAYHEEASQAEEHGLAALVERLHHGRLPVDRAADVFEAAVYEPLLRHAMRRSPELAAFDGDTHARLIARLRELERTRLEITRAEVALAHHDRLPKRSGNSPLERELAQPEPDLSFRELLARSGSAIQAIKPVFMMSPLSGRAASAAGRGPLRSARDRRGEPGGGDERPWRHCPRRSAGRGRRRPAAAALRALRGQPERCCRREGRAPGHAAGPREHPRSLPGQGHAAARAALALP
jgi:hypothetical protein